MEESSIFVSFVTHRNFLDVDMEYLLPKGDQDLLALSWWRHDIETRSALLGICEGNPPVVCFHKGPVMRSFDVSVLLVWKGCWTDSRSVGDFRSYGLLYATSLELYSPCHCWYRDRITSKHSMVARTWSELAPILPASEQFHPSSDMS